MRKITLLILVLFTYWQGFSQFGCGSGVPITNGYTALGITTPGTGGAEDWNTNPTGTSISSSYWDDDVYLFEYTSGSTSEQISMTIFSRNSWNGIGIFDTCTGTTFSGELDAEGAFGSNTSKTVTATISPSTTVYIAVGQWGSPNDLDFDVTSFTVTQILCAEPTNLSASNITTTSADLSWTEVGTATTWNIEVVAAGSTPTGNANFSGVTNPYTASGLTPDTDYEFYVQADCGANQSSWSGPMTFKTLCSAFSAPWSDDVETHSTTTSLTDSECWTTTSMSGYDWNIDGNGSTPSSATGPSGAYSGSNYFYTEGSSGNVGDIAELYTPLVDVTSLTNASFSFYYHMYGEFIGDLYVDVYDGTTWVNGVDLISGEQQTAQGDSWLPRLVDLSSYTGVIQIRFRAISAGNSTDFEGDIALDDFSFDELPSCVFPTSLDANNITSNGADLSWVENGSATIWNVEVVTAGTTPTGTPTSSGVSNPYSATGLSSATNYEFYVQADCGSGDLSSWSGPYSFTTECLAYTVPFCENFDSSTVGSSTNQTTPICWSFIGSGAGFGYVRASTSNSSPNSFYMSNSSDNTGDYILVSPEISNVSSGNNRVNFWVDGSANQDLIVGTMTDANDPLTFTSIQTITLATSSYENYIIDIPLGTDSYLAFKHGQTGTYDSYYFDDICIEEIPSCLAPTNLSTNYVTDSEAQLSWTEAGAATLWNVEVVTAGTAATGVPTATGVSNPYNVIGLIPETDYEYYVQADCGAGDLSSWSGPYSFTTTCSAVIAPWFDDVEAHSTSTSFSESECWTATSDSAYDWNIDGNASTPSSNTGPSGAYSGDNYFYTEGSSGSIGDEAELYTPLIDISALTTPSLNFYYHMYGADMGNLYIDVFNGTNWVNDVYSILGQQQTSATDAWLNTYVDLSSFSGTIQLRFRAVTAGNSSNYEGDIAIDDISIDELPSCVPPDQLTATNVTDSGAELSWIQVGTATLWNVEVVTAGTTATGVPTATGVSNPYNVTGLTPETDYEYYVQADCGAGDLSSWSGPYSFTTTCAAVIAPWFDDVETHSTTTSLSESECWTATSDSAYDWNIDGNASTPSTNTGPSGAYSGDNYFYTEGSNGSIGDEAELYTPFIDISSLNTPVLEFYYHMYGSDMGDLYIDIYDGTNWVNGVTSILGQQQTSDTDAWLNTYVDLSSYTGVIQVRFRAVTAGNSSNYEGDIAIDDISVDEAPFCDIPTNITATNITETAADISWTENGSATEWEVIYGLSGFDPNTAGTTIVDNDGTLGVLLTGLTEGQDYDVYVRANCSTGFDSDWSLVGSFTTVCPAVSNVIVSNETATTADISWTENGSATEWEILYGMTGFDPTTSGTSVLDNDGTLGETLTGLMEGQDYDVYVRAMCSSTDSAWVGPEMFTTVCPAVTNVVVSNETATTADVSWTENGSATEWEILYGMTGFDPNTAGTSVLDNDGTLGEILTGLTEGQDYDVYVRAMCSSTDSAWVGPEMFTTVCPAVTNVVVSSETATTADVSWTENGSATEWEILYGMTGFDPNTAGTSVLDNDGTLGEILTGLTEGQDYDVYVRAMCSSVDSDWTVATTFTTVCPAVTGITFSNITESSADVSWTENGSATEWEILYGMTGFDPTTAGTSVLDNDGTLGETLTGLTEGQDYDVYVRAMCSSVDSDWTVVATFTTVCPAVTGITISNITTDSAEVSWTENGSATEWEILYGPVNFNPNTAGTSVLDNDGTLGETLTGLTEGEDYDVYVRAICSSVDSAWVGPETFSTDELGVENHLLDGIKLYPNPVKNVLNFESSNQIDNISVYNLLGERILDVQPKNLNTRISLESLQAGVYLVKAQKGSAMKVFKIVKE